MIILYSLLGAFSKFPYLTIPLCVGVFLFCNYIAVKLGISESGRVLFTILTSVALIIAIIVPSWLVYKAYDESIRYEADKEFWAQFPISAKDAVNIVSNIPEVQAEIVAMRALNYPKTFEDNDQNIPQDTPFTQDGLPMLYLLEVEGSSPQYVVYVRMTSGELTKYAVDPATGDIVVD